MMRESVFIPSSRGNCNLDCFRIYEASKLGAIPIVMGPVWEIKQTFGYCEPPFIFVRSWNEGVERLRYLLKNPKELEELQLKLISWWEETEDRLQNDLYDYCK